VYEIELNSDRHLPEQLLNQLAGFMGTQQHDCIFRLKRSSAPYRGIDASVVVAIVSGAASLLGIVITAMLTVCGRQGTIKMKSRNGDEIEFPASTSQEKVQEILRLQAELGVARITLISSGDPEPQSSEPT
jgi:hypothetical protein